MDRGVWWATVHGASKELDMTGVTRQQHYCLYTVYILRIPAAQDHQGTVVFGTLGSLLMAEGGCAGPNRKHAFSPLRWWHPSRRVD